MTNEITIKEYKCGATGEVCRCKQREDGSFPCDECKIGIEFRKQWENQPILSDD